MAKVTNAQVCIAGDTALLFWRAVREQRMSQPVEVAEEGLACCVSHITDVAQLVSDSLHIRREGNGFCGQYKTVQTITELDGSRYIESHAQPLGLALPSQKPMPIHVLVKGEKRPHPTQGITRHQHSGTLPPGSLLHISENLLVTSPEMTIIQCCLSTRDLPNVELMSELCGTYALGPHGVSCTYNISPLTSAESIAAFAKDALRIRGRKAALRAAKMVRNNLASPRETALLLVLTSSPEVGGFGLPMPTANLEILLADTPIADALNEARLRGDLVWFELKIIVEYDGFDDHERTPEQVAHDKERRSALAALGFLVIVVTKRDTSSPERLRNKVGMIAMALRVKLPEFDDKQMELHRALIKWSFAQQRERLPFGYGYR